MVKQDIACPSLPDFMSWLIFWNNRLALLQSFVKYEKEVSISKEIRWFIRFFRFFNLVVLLFIIFIIVFATNGTDSTKTKPN